MAGPQFKKKGCSLEYTLGSGETAAVYAPFIKGNIRGMVIGIENGTLAAGTQGDKILISTDGDVWEIVPKTTGTAWTVGQSLFWNATTGKFSTVDEDGLYFGVAEQAASSGATTGTIMLDKGMPAANTATKAFTLALGTTGAVADARITATSVLKPSRKAVNSSTALGHLVYSITAGVGYTIEARETATPADVEVGDLSAGTVDIVY